MIDFEHSTFGGFRNDPLYDGPDRGYLIGVKHLLNIIRDLSDELTVDECCSSSIHDSKSNDA